MKVHSISPERKQQLLDCLPQVEVLQGVPIEQIAWLIDHSELFEVPAGEHLFEPGQAADHFYLLVEGALRLYMIQQNSQRSIMTMQQGDITGILPFSRMTEARGYGLAETRLEVLALSREGLKEMVCLHYELTENLVHFMTSRVRDFTRHQEQSDRLLSLGKLSAGLMHELNNPASAIARSAIELKKHLQVLPEGFKQVIKIRLEDEQVDIINNALFAKIAAYNPNQLSLSQKTELEDAIADWLEEHDIEDGYEYAEDFVEFGFTTEDLQMVFNTVNANDFEPIINWLKNNLVTEKMVREIGESSERIADLVKSVKGYTHMDQGMGKQEVSIHEGLRSTVTMLQHKLKKNNIQIVEDFTEGKPVFQGIPGRVNQIWTNVIDNAIDALENTDEAVLSIKTLEDENFVKVDIYDNGPGIPQEVINKIFDPFFTTKAIGKGTGVGLDLVNQIVNEHRGDVKVTSKAGETIFKFCFPKV